MHKIAIIQQKIVVKLFSLVVESVILVHDVWRTCPTSGTRQIVLTSELPAKRWVIMMVSIIIQREKNFVILWKWWRLPCYLCQPCEKGYNMALSHLICFYFLLGIRLGDINDVSTSTLLSSQAFETGSPLLEEQWNHFRMLHGYEVMHQGWFMY